MSKIDNFKNGNQDEESDWTKVAEDAEQKAQEELEKIKREAHEELTSSKNRFNNPDDPEKE